MKKEQVENQQEDKDLTGGGVTRRGFIKGIALGAAGIAASGILPGYTAMAYNEGGEEITKGEFIAKISDYFAWPHQSEYNDIWKGPLMQFKDVKTKDRFGKQIECAYEQGIIGPDPSGNFNPHSRVSRRDAAVVFVKAFKIPTISEDAKDSLKALVNLGYMSGKMSLDAYITKGEVDQIFSNITSTMVAPVQALPMSNTDITAPRRYVKLYTPTVGAKIYFTKAISIDKTQNPPEPIISPNNEYTIAEDGHIKEDYTSNEHTYVTYKAIAVKDGMVISPLQTFNWHLYRPKVDEFKHTFIQEKTKTSPAVYEIYNDSESVRAMAWYIEGQDRGIIFDALQTDAAVKNLKEYLDNNLATKPYSLIIGHEHGDHDAQAPNFLKAGVPVYLNKRGWAATASASGPFAAIFATPEAQAMVNDVDEGDVFELGGCTLNVYAMPGHANGNVVLQDKANGLIFASDIYGCTRAGSADNVAVSGLRADLLLSFAQQAYSNYKKDGGKTNRLFTGHDEYPLADNNLKLFEEALQQVIDKGEEGCSSTLRGGNNPMYSRTTLIGDMWKDGTNWISLLLAGKIGDKTEYLSSTTDITALPYMSGTANNGLNYNFGNHMKYSVLSNIEIEGGELVGKMVQWAKTPASFSWGGSTITVEPALPNKFNPWSYDYTIKVPKKNNNITIIPTAMSTKVRSIEINGKKVAYRSSCKVLVSNGSVITIKIVAPDNVTTSTYTFTVEQK